MKKIEPPSGNYPLHDIFPHKNIRGFATCDIDTGENTLSDLESKFTPRPSDIVISTYMRSGTTWLQTLVYELVGAPNGPLQDLHLQCPWLESVPPLGPTMEEIEAFESPRVLKNHLRWSWMPEHMKKTCRFIYCYRNPKDQAVSQWQFYKFAASKLSQTIANYTFSEFFDKVYTKERVSEYGLWEDHVIDWLQEAKDANILYLTYEDLSENTERELRKIASFLGLEVTDEKIAEVLSTGSFKAMKKNPRVTQRIDAVIPDADVANHPFIRKGVVGGWTEYISGEESKALDIKVEKVRKAGGYIRCNL